MFPKPPQKKGQKMNSDKKWVTLNNGAKMPTIGMGTWHHGPREEIDAALRQEPLLHRLKLKIANRDFNFFKLMCKSGM